MAFFRAVLVFSLLLIVTADPNTLQGRYGTPSHSHDHNDHSHDHGTDTAGSVISGEINTGFVSKSVSANSDPSNNGVSTGNSQGSGPLFLQGDSISSSAANGGFSSQFDGSATSSGSPLVGRRQQVFASQSVPSQVPFASSAFARDSDDGEFGSIGGVDSFGNVAEEDVTITKVNTVDRFETLTNVVYNSIPVTLTEFVKTTVTRPTVEVITTAVDDIVTVSKDILTNVAYVTVTDTTSAYQCATDVSTDYYTITHLAHDIRQQVVTSTIQQTQVFRPTVVSTRIYTETDTQTVVQTVTNTVIVDSNNSPNLFDLRARSASLDGQLSGSTGGNFHGHNGGYY